MDFGYVQQEASLCHILNVHEPFQAQKIPVTYIGLQALLDLRERCSSAPGTQRDVKHVCRNFSLNLPIFFSFPEYVDHHSTFSGVELAR